MRARREQWDEPSRQRETWLGRYVGEPKQRESWLGRISEGPKGEREGWFARKRNEPIREREPMFGRNMAVMAGVAVGILGSRILPPMLAMANGSVRARLGEGPFDRLKQDHRQILAILDRMVDREDDATMSQSALFLSLKRMLAKHAMAEEDIVYPVLHDRAHAAEDAKKLYSEHADMKIHLWGLEEAVKQGLNWDTRVQALRSLIRRHVEDEESVQFPRLETLMDEQLSRATPAQIRREKAMIL